MLRVNNTVWSNVPNTSNYFRYDYFETYWVVDEEYFNKNITSNCTITIPVNMNQGHDRILKKVPCTEWHFYLCQKKVTTIPSENLTAKVNPWKEST